MAIYPRFVYLGTRNINFPLCSIPISRILTKIVPMATPIIGEIATRSLHLTASASTVALMSPPIFLQENQNRIHHIIHEHQQIERKQHHKIITTTNTTQYRQAHTHASSSPPHRLDVSSTSSVNSKSNKTNPETTMDSVSFSGTVTDESTSENINTNTTSTLTSSLATVGADMEELLKLASNKVTPLSLKDMYKYAIVDVDNPEQRIRNAIFLHNELQIRVAQRAVDLLTLPHGLNEIPAVLQVAHVYLLYLEKFRDLPRPKDVESEDLFTDMLQSMVLERSSIPNAIANGVDTWIKTEEANSSSAVAEREAGKNNNKNSDGEIIDDDRKQKRKQRYVEMEDALYRFFTARVGLRFLTEHHILSSPLRAANQCQIFSRMKHENNTSNDYNENRDDTNSFLGCIQPNCCPSREVRKVVEAVRKQTIAYYGDGFCPEIQIVDGDARQGRNNFTYVPHHLHYMVGELLKNSCRATIKNHIETGECIHPIKIVIVKGTEDVTIKIADRGGGIPRSKMSHIWQFAHSTADEDEIENVNKTDLWTDEITGASIRGFGLPLARIYARYLGGELTLKSLEGYGVDAYLHMPRLGDNCENLPLPVQFSPSNLNSNPRRKMERPKRD